MTRFYIKDTEEFDRACRLLDKREIATPFRSLGCSSCSTSTTRRYEHAAT